MKDNQVDYLTLLEQIREKLERKELWKRLKKHGKKKYKKL